MLYPSIYIYTYIHTYVHVYMHQNANIDVLHNINTYTHTYIHTYIQFCRIESFRHPGWGWRQFTHTHIHTYSLVESNHPGILGEGNANLGRIISIFSMILETELCDQECANKIKNILVQVCVHVSVYTCLCICMYIYIYIYMYTSILSLLCFETYISNYHGCANTRHT